MRRMVGPACAARVRKNQDILLTIHEGLGLGGIAACAALLNEEMAILGLEGPDRSARDFCHGLVAKSPEDLIERRGDSAPVSSRKGSATMLPSISTSFCAWIGKACSR